MPLSKTHKGLMWGAGGLIAIGLIYLWRQASLLYDSIYTVAGIIVKNVSLNDISFVLLLKIENKGDLSVDITKQDYNVYVNNMFVANVQYPPKGTPESEKDKYTSTIPANGSGTVPINVQFNPYDLLKAGVQNISAILSNQNNVIIDIKGKLTFKAGLGTAKIISMKDFPFEESLKLSDITKNSMQLKS